MSILKTKNKNSLVDAINELIDNGVLEVVNEAILGLENRVDDAEASISNQLITISEQTTTIQNQQALIDALQQAQYEFGQKSSLMDQDVSVIKNEQQNLSTELGKKLDFTQYKSEYDTIVEDMNNTVANLENTKSELDNVKNNVVYKVEIISKGGY